MLSTVKVLPRRIAIIGAVLMVGLAWVIGASHLSPASAATINNAITGVSIKQASAGPTTPMELDLTWAVPDTANPGDTFTIQLPDKLTSMTTSFDLLAPDGSVVAKAVVVNGMVTFTLTNYVSTHDAVHGSAFFSVRWNNANTPTTGPVGLDFQAGSKVFHDTVNKTGVKGVPRTGPHKTGFWTHLGTITGTDALTWNLDSPRGPATTVHFQDNVGAGQTFDCASVKVRLGGSLDANGVPTSLTAFPASKISVKSCSANSLTITAGPITGSQLIRVTYRTNVTDPGRSSYDNSAAVSINGSTSHMVSSSVKVQGAGGNGQGVTPSGSPTSTSRTTTSTTSTTSSSSPSSTSRTTSVSGTSTSRTTSGGGATVLGTKLTAGVSPSSLARTGANVMPALLVAALLLGAGLLLVVGVQLPLKGRKH